MLYNDSVHAAKKMSASNLVTIWRVSKMRIAITGAATGIGAETVKLFKTAGHEIFAFDIVKPDLADHWIEVDLADLPSIDAAVSELGGKFDVLINNAGLPPRSNNQVKLLAVNVLGLMQMTRSMCPKLAPGARIVNTASRAGLMWRENLDEVKALMSLTKVSEVETFVASRGIDPTRAYNLSKEAVIVYTKGLTRHLLDLDIRVNSVSPAPVATGILDDFMAALGDRAAAALSLPGRAASAEEVAKVIAFLASEDSSWVKGHDILVDGGVSAMVSAQELGFERGET